MAFITWEYQSWHDLETIAKLAYIAPVQYLHVFDLPYRLASWALDKPKNFKFWFRAAGELAAVALLQEAFLTLEYLIHPRENRAVLEKEIIQWGVGLGQEVADEQETTFPVVVWLKEDQLQPERVALHQATFSSTIMREPWRLRTLQMPQYRPEIDLVAVAPDGRLAGFCVGWLHPHQPLARIEPMGVHPAFQRRGVGSALITALFRRLHAHHIQFVSLHTSSTNQAALRLYEFVGFRHLHTLQCHHRLFWPQGSPA